MLHSKTRKYLLVVLLFGLALVLFFLSLSLYTRPVHDDFYFLTPVGSDSIQSNWGYWNRNGRLTDTLIYSILYPVPYITQIAPLLTTLIVFTGFFSLTYAIVRHYLKLEQNSLLFVLVITCILTLATLLTVPSIYASFYWLAGGVPHTWSAALVLIYIGLVIMRLKKKGVRLRKDLIVFSALPIVISDTYESASLTLMTLTALVLSLVYCRKLKVDVRVLWLSLISAFAGLLIELFSPGALDRRKVTTGGGMLERLSGAPADLWRHWTGIMPDMLVNKSIFVILFLMGALVGIYMIRKRLVSVRQAGYLGLLTILVVGIVISINIMAQWLAMGDSLQIRSYFTTVAWLSIGSVFLGFFTGQILQSMSRRQYPAYGAMLAILVLVVSNYAFIPYVLNVRSQFISFSSTWDTSNTLVIRSIKENRCRIPIPSISINGTANIQPNIRYWMNNEMDHYYLIREKVGRNCGVVSNGDVQKYFFYSSSY